MTSASRARVRTMVRVPGIVRQTKRSTAPQDLLHLFFHGALQDQLSPEASQLAQTVPIPVAVVHQAGDGLFKTGARRYSFLHGAVLLSVTLFSFTAETAPFCFYSNS